MKFVGNEVKESVPSLACVIIA